MPNPKHEVTEAELPWDAARLITPAWEPIKPVPWSVSSRSMAPDRCSPALLS